MRYAGLHRSVVLLLLLGASAAPTHVARARQAPAPKGHTLAAIVYEGDMAALLQHLAKEFDVTVGFEAGPGQMRPQVKINLREANLRDVLDAVVQSQPAYRWRQEGGFVDVYPAE